MLTSKQVLEIKEHLERAQSPVFFYDNDPDGLCSFLLLQRFIGRGKGVPIKSFPGLDSSYVRKISELNADYVFILDKPVVSEDFFKEISQINIPVVWIDHHDVQVKVPDFVSYYNPLLNKAKTCEPVTALCYQITQKKDDLWLAVAGCIYDRHVPEFYSDFKEDYSELCIESKDAFDIFYKSQIGKIVQIFDFGLKDRTSNVVIMMKFLSKARGPYDVLQENTGNRLMHSRFIFLDKKYKKLLEKALQVVDDEMLLFFQYGGEYSLSAELSNELSYRFPKKIVVVAYITGVKANISVRGKSVRDYVLKAIEGLAGATGGGHEDAVGAKVNLEDLEIFRERMESFISKK